MSNVNHSGVDKQWKDFMTDFLSIFYKCFPMKLIKRTNAPILYFSDEEIVACKKRLDILLVLSRMDNVFKKAYDDTKKIMIEFCVVQGLKVMKKE